MKITYAITLALNLMLCYYAVSDSEKMKKCFHRMLQINAGVDEDRYYATVVSYTYLDNHNYHSILDNCQIITVETGIYLVHGRAYPDMGTCIKTMATYFVLYTPKSRKPR